ncbi:MAG TPA: DUF4430 domain-containing protein [Xanthobacteraceae bacterium]|jgi:hypothetical protein
MSGALRACPSRRRILIGSILPLFLLGLAAVAPAAKAQSSAQSVRLVIDYGDGVLKIFDRLPWARGNTVLDVMEAAQRSPHGITFTFTGQGASAFVAKIDDVANQGGGATARNWQYWVNTSYADRSFAVYSVDPADTVFWRFTTPNGK